MIIYFADRAMNILGSASTGLPKGLMITNDKKTEEISEGVAIFECNLDYNFVNPDEDEEQEVDLYLIPKNLFLAKCYSKPRQQNALKEIHYKNSLFWCESSKNVWWVE